MCAHPRSLWWSLALLACPIHSIKFSPRVCDWRRNVWLAPVSKLTRTRSVKEGQAGRRPRTRQSRGLPCNRAASARSVAVYGPHARQRETDHCLIGRPVVHAITSDCQEYSEKVSKWKMQFYKPTTTNPTGQVVWYGLQGVGKGLLLPLHLYASIGVFVSLGCDE